MASEVVSYPYVAERLAICSANVNPGTGEQSNAAAEVDPSKAPLVYSWDAQGVKTLLDPSTYTILWNTAATCGSGDAGSDTGWTTTRPVNQQAMKIVLKGSTSLVSSNSLKLQALVPYRALAQSAYPTLAAQDQHGALLSYLAYGSSGSNQWSTPASGQYQITATRYSRYTSPASGETAAFTLADSSKPGVNFAVEGNPALTVATTTDKATYQPGETITTTITVKNTGITYLATTPDLGACAGASGPSGDSNGDGVLSLGETWTYTCSHSITEADLTAGKWTTTVTVTGDDGSSATANPTSSSTVTVVVKDKPSISLKVTADDNDGELRPGQVVVWTYTLTNTSRSPLTEYTINDNKLRLVCSKTGVSVAPGASVTCSKQGTMLASGDVAA